MIDIRQVQRKMQTHSILKKKGTPICFGQNVKNSSVLNLNLLTHFSPHKNRKLKIKYLPSSSGLGLSPIKPELDTSGLNI